MAGEGKKVLIWSTFVSNVELISLELEDLGAVFIRGDVKTEEFDEHSYFSNLGHSISEEEEMTREERIFQFKNDDQCMVLVANPAAAGEGISLHDVCHHSIYIDRNFDAREFMKSLDQFQISIYLVSLEKTQNIIMILEEKRARNFMTYF